MTATLLLQPSRWRDVAADAALVATSAALGPIQVLVAAAEPERTQRATGLSTIAATPTAVLRALPLVDSVVVLGGRPLSSRARDAHLFGLAELYALMTAVSTTGRRFALVGVAAEALTTRRDAFFADRLVRGSSLTVLDNAESALHLTAAGAPGPLRVGADLAWLQALDPPRPVSGGTEVWCPLTFLDVAANGGAEVTAQLVAGVCAAVSRQLQTDSSVVVQAWRCGFGAGDDLEAASDVAAALHRLGVRARCAIPPLTLAAERDLLSRAQLCISCDPHTTMAASTAGVPLIAWPHDSATEVAASRLHLPLLPDSPEAVVAAALARGSGLAVVRQQSVAASETADLLRVLLTRGAELATYQRIPRTEHFQGIRPTGVMR